MRFFHRIHLWLSVPFGIIITVICFSGAMLVFEPEITRSLRRDVYYVASVESRPVDLGELMESVKATLPDSVSITGVTVFNDRERTYQVNLSKPRRAALFVDQYSGEITGRYERMAFFSIMFRLPFAACQPLPSLSRSPLMSVSKNSWIQICLCQSFLYNWQ